MGGGARLAAGGAEVPRSGYRGDVVAAAGDMDWEVALLGQSRGGGGWTSGQRAYTPRHD